MALGHASWRRADKTCEEINELRLVMALRWAPLSRLANSIGRAIRSSHS